MRVFVHDYETTGVNSKTCAVVQSALCFADIHEDGSYDILVSDVQILDPGEPIPDGASKVHGIYDKDVVGRAPYAEYLESQYKVVNETDLDYIMGFNSKAYDDVIAYRFGLNKLPSFDLYKAARRLKSMGHLEKANLGATYRTLTGKEPENAHDAFADLVMTLDLIKPTMVVLELATVSELLTWLNTPKANTSMAMPFGRHKGKKVRNLPKSYVRWALENMYLEADLKVSLEKCL